MKIVKFYAGYVIKVKATNKVQKLTCFVHYNFCQKEQLSKRLDKFIVSCMKPVSRKLHETYQDIFQKDLEENLNVNMKVFENSENLIEKEFNNIIGAITSIRNKIKANFYSGDLKPIAKVIIEQLLTIRNFLALKNKKD